MAESSSERRQRRPKRTGAYALVVAVGAVVALASAWQAAHPRVSARLLWQGRQALTSSGKSADSPPAVP